ncbi:toxin-antitoxin system TumE family protein [Thiohalomonas denitrificans]|uniref:toxin-antitoxin system TumE family protein n=1 Tax=Thiohalomonas denitrificans TaxID=415747 RepID=UPI0026EBA0F8|nr:DUF6516 family protein [Thiohalomonas denitrificans]
MDAKGLETLLDLDGQIFGQEGGYWIKVEAQRVAATPNRPHGVSYSLTLHAIDGGRVLEFDNAHAVRVRGNRFSGRSLEYDHRHRTEEDEGIPYEFETPEQLLADFFQAVDRYLKAQGVLKR